MEIKSEIRFGDRNIKEAFLELGSKKLQEKQLKQWLERALEDIEKNAFCGIQIPKKLIPKEYHSRFGRLENLWKYNLPNAWRLIYTIKKDQIVVLSIILEWMDHTKYNRMFKY